MAARRQLRSPFMNILKNSGRFIRGESSGGPVIGNWLKYDGSAASPITQSEHLVGLHHAHTDELPKTVRIAFVSSTIMTMVMIFIGLCRIDNLTSTVTRLSQSGCTIGPHNNGNAATPLDFDYDLVTTNASTRNRVPNLQVVDYLAET